MEHKHSIGSGAFILIAVCILGSVAASLSLQQMIPYLNKWQKVGYAIVGGIFIAVSAVIVNEILSFFQNE